MIPIQKDNFIINELKLLTSKKIIAVNLDEYFESFIEKNLDEYFEIEYVYLDDLISIEPTNDIFIFNISHLDSKCFDLIDLYVKTSEISIFCNVKESISDIKSKINLIWKNIILKYKTREICQLGFVYPNYKNLSLQDSFNLVKVQLNNVVPMNHNIYNDNVLLFKKSFDELNILYSESFNELKLGATNIIFLPFSTDEFTRYAFDYNYVVVQFEQIGFIDNFDIALSYDRYKSYIQLMKNSVQIWDYSKLNIKFLNNIGFDNIKYLPIGFHENIKLLDNNKTKDIDILFYGSLNERRISILEELKNRGVKLKVLSNSYELERNQYIERSKIILNINWNEKTILAEHRLSFLLNNKCFVISEFPQSEIPDYYKQSLVFCNRNDIVNTCLFYLKSENEKMREFISNKGFNHFSKNKMTHNLKNILELKSI